ncbi:MAG TPA: 5-(carboxyamino)imidazole ribonucleotide synthase [Mycobacteriales bacterium]|nr:5-(carboxyamino)imidazole ribonucleotide synthase [Mycobacteriales bacterium]
MTRADVPAVGMVGGGQLARMTHQAAIALGLSLRVLAENPDDSAALVAHDVDLGAPDDLDALRSFAKACDVVTFDHEHVPTAHLRALESDGVVVRPGADALAHAQDKLYMRERLSALGFPVPGFASVHDIPDVAVFAEDHGWPVVLKAVRGGYDGRGVWHLPGPPAELPGPNVYVEQRVPIVHELAVQVARRPSGEMRTWPVVETVQRDGICHEVIAPAPRLSPGLAAEADRIATSLAEALGVVGLLAVELFEAPGGLLINELAMRPHNSGHWSIEGATTSQFEQHLRAVLDWPLGDTAPRAPVTVMVNLLGGPTTDFARTLPRALGEVPDAAVHLYGKAPRPGRKLGHVTVLGDDVVETRERARRAVELLRGDA